MNNISCLKCKYFAKAVDDEYILCKKKDGYLKIKKDCADYQTVNNKIEITKSRIITLFIIPLVVCIIGGIILLIIGKLL